MPQFTKKTDKNGVLLCDNVCIDFLSKLIAFDPAQRMNLTDALIHPWLNSLRDPALN